MLWKLSIALALAMPVPAGQSTVIVVTGPTVIAFFPPVSEVQLANDADTVEALSDFQEYARRVRAPLGRAGIEFHEVYTRSFRVRTGGKLTVFRPRRVGVGYYFVAPGKKARVEYGVNTDAGILQSAREYFGKK